MKLMRKKLYVVLCLWLGLVCSAACFASDPTFECDCDGRLALDYTKFHDTDRVKRYELPRADVDLDLPPEDRFDEAIAVIVKTYGYGCSLEPVLAFIKDLVDAMLPGYKKKFAEIFRKQYPEYALEYLGCLAEYKRYAREYAKEVEEKCGKKYELVMSEETWLAASFLIEIIQSGSATPWTGEMGCFSIVAQDQDNHIRHGRNLDFFAIFRNVVIAIDWKKNKEPFGRSVSFAGLFDVLTFVKPNAFSFSMNLRNTNALTLYEIHRLAKDGWHPGTISIRDEMFKTNSYSEVVAVFSDPRQFQTISSGYYIFGGVDAGEGVIIAYDCNQARSFPLGTSGAYYNQGHEWFIAQDNTDPEVPDSPEDPRRLIAINGLKTLGQKKGASFNGLWMVLSSPGQNTRGVLNDSTLFTALMSARSGKLEAYPRYFPWYGSIYAK